MAIKTNRTNNVITMSPEGPGERVSPGGPHLRDCQRRVGTEGISLTWEGLNMLRVFFNALNVKSYFPFLNNNNTYLGVSQIYRKVSRL